MVEVTVGDVEANLDQVMGAIEVIEDLVQTAKEEMVEDKTKETIEEVAIIHDNKRKVKHAHQSQSEPRNL